MWNRGNIYNGSYLQARGLKRPNGSLPAGPYSFYPYIHLRKAMLLGIFCHSCSCYLCCIRGGYRTAEENTIEGEPLGVIPLDTIFSPIKVVSFKVDNTRVGQMTNFDKLSVDIKTNGSIKPEDALSQASKIINDYMSLLIDLSDETQKDLPIFE